MKETAMNDPQTPPVDKHTPGPWFINGPWHVQASQPVSGLTLPCVVAHVIQGHGVADNERLGNARLIAAAPDLLAACRKLVAGLLATASLGLNETEVATLRAGETAIAKATQE